MPPAASSEGNKCRKRASCKAHPLDILQKEVNQRELCALHCIFKFVINLLTKLIDENLTIILWMLNILYNLNKCIPLLIYINLF